MAHSPISFGVRTIRHSDRFLARKSFYWRLYLHRSTAQYEKKFDMCQINKPTQATSERCWQSNIYGKRSCCIRS